MSAAKAKNVETVKILIRAGADLNVQDSEGRTALMLAASNSDSALMRVLRDAGVETLQP